MENRFFIFFLLSAFVLCVGCRRTEVLETVQGPSLLALSADGVTDKISILEPKTMSIAIRVKAERLSSSALIVSIKADNTLVERYNRENGTSYRMAPSESFSLTSGEMLLPRYNIVSSTAYVEIDSAGLPDAQEYLLPIAIDHVNGEEGVEIDKEKGILWLILSKRQLPPVDNLEKTGWSIVHCSSYLPQNYSGHGFVRSDGSGSSVTGYPGDLIDNDLASIWTYNYKGGTTYDSVPFYIVVDLGKEETVRGLVLHAMRGNRDMMNSVDPVPNVQCGQCTVELTKELTGNGMEDIYSLGRSEWTYSEDFGPSVLKNQMENTIWLKEIVRARYVRFTYRRGWKSLSESSPSYNGGSLAELDILGNHEIINIE